MAFNIFYKVQFASLRNDTVYTASIYKDGSPLSPYPLTMFGGAAPFTTEEDASDNQFAPIRTQSGYLRIVDNGKDTNGNALPANWWKDFIPTNDTNRPVVLSHVSGNTTVIDWVGFLQTQTFSSQLYNGAQEREYPLRCPFSILNGISIPTSDTNIHNFAYLLKLCIDNIPELCRPTSIIIQGGSDAQNWLLKRIDWQNFIDVDAENNLTSKYDLYQCLEDMCQFWGWTARIQGKTLYLTCSDDSNESGALTLTYANLTNMAGGTAAGTVSTMYSTIALSGDIFASINNDDCQVVGPDKVTIQSDSGKADSTLVEIPQSVEDYLRQQSYTTEGSGDRKVYYYGDLHSFPQSSPTVIKSPLLQGTALTSYGSFTYAYCNAIKGKAIRIMKSYSSTVTPAFFDSVFNHSFFTSSLSENVSYGGFQLQGNIYQNGERYMDAYSDISAAIWPALKDMGTKSMYMRFGVGTDRGSAKWFNGSTWQSTTTSFLVSVGNKDNILRIGVGTGTASTVHKYIPCAGQTLQGKVFVDILGSDDMPQVSGQRSFFITDFKVVFSRWRDFDHEDTSIYIPEYQTSAKYTTGNAAKTGIEANIDNIFASENAMEFGYGVLINPDGTLVGNVPYNGGTQGPEAMVMNRISNYWNLPKRLISCELRTNAQNVGSIAPNKKVTLDSTTFHPIAISRNWRDDVSLITLLEV